MDFMERSNMARINADLKAEVVRLKEMLIEIKDFQLKEKQINDTILSRQINIIKEVEAGTMTEDDRKLLTEYLGECLHPDSETVKGAVVGILYCSQCKKFNPNNRTFNTWQDLGDLKEKMAEKNDWYLFEGWIERKWDKLIFVEEIQPTLFEWLLNPTRFCQLIADWMKERREK